MGCKICDDRYFHSAVMCCSLTSKETQKKMLEASEHAGPANPVLTLLATEVTGSALCDVSPRFFLCTSGYVLCYGWHEIITVPKDQ